MAKNVEEIVLQARDEASQAIGRVASELGEMGQILTRLGAAGPAGLAIAGVGAALTGVVLVGKGLADTVEHLDLLSARTGVSIETLQVLGQQISEAGGDAGGLAQALSFLNRAIATQDPLLKKLGITTTDTFTAFMQLADVFAGSGDTAKKTEVAYQLLGRGAGDLVALLPSLASGFKGMREELERMGGLIGNEGGVAQQARALDGQLDQLSRNWNSALTRIKGVTVPWANDIVAAFNDVFDALSGRTKTAEERLGLTDLTGPEKVQKLLAMIQNERQFAKPNDPVAQANIRYLQSLIDYYADLELAAKKTGDTLKNVELGTPDEAAKAREDRLKELMRIMQVTRPEAEQLAAALDRLDDAKKRADIQKSLALGPEVPAAVEQYNQAIEDMARLFGIDTQAAQGMVDKLNELDEAQKRHAVNVKLGVEYEKPAGPELPPGGIRDARSVADDWKDTLNQITDTAGIMDSTFQALFGGLESGFNQVFADIVAGTATVGSALKALWHSVVNAILGELARLAAAAVLKVVAGFLGFPGFGAASATPATAAASAARSFGQGGNIFNVYGYDVRDTVRDLTSMAGRQRLGASRVAIVGEF